MQLKATDTYYTIIKFIMVLAVILVFSLVVMRHFWLMVIVKIVSVTMGSPALDTGWTSASGSFISNV